MLPGVALSLEWHWCLRMKSGGADGHFGTVLGWSLYCLSGVDCVALGLGWHWGRHMKSGDADGHLGTVLALVSALRML